MMLITVTESHNFAKEADRFLSWSERDELTDFLAAHPKSGRIIQGTHGARKLRWAREGMGKRGGTRVIYYFHNETMPLLLIDLYAKNEKENLSQAERNLLADIVDAYVKSRSPK